jgi:hypothetical protein
VQHKVCPVSCVPGESGNADSQTLKFYERSDGGEIHAEKNWARAANRESGVTSRGAHAP